MKKWIKRLEGYKPTESYEINHAIAVTGVVTAVVAVLVVAYALLSFLRPDVIVEQGGKMVVVKDHWVVLRSLLLKTSGCLIGAVVAGWGVLVFNHISPVDYLKKVGEHAIASGILCGCVFFGMVYLWCFG